MNLLNELALDSWNPGLSMQETQQLQEALESGGVLFMPRLGLQLTERERRFLSPNWSDGKSKNINLRGDETVLRGAKGNRDDLLELQQLLVHYTGHSQSLIQSLFPGYIPYLKRAGTSFRPCKVEGRATSWRKDDMRLHVDAFPSNPTHGLRILRVFTNINLAGQPRVWRVGEPFEKVAQRYLPKIHPPLPGSAWLLEQLHITKSRRSEYDHIMLRLHDLLKADLSYQQEAPRQEVPFPPGSTWIVYSDLVLHAVMSGQYLLEQTFHLPIEGLGNPATSPLRLLEKLTQRSLV